MLVVHFSLSLSLSLFLLFLRLVSWSIFLPRIWIKNWKKKQGKEVACRYLNGLINKSLSRIVVSTQTSRSLLWWTVQFLITVVKSRTRTRSYGHRCTSTFNIVDAFHRNKRKDLCENSETTEEWCARACTNCSVVLLTSFWLLRSVS
jgi:hypothetical protein